MTRSSSPPPTPYASEVLRLYALLPDTPDEPRPADRRLALALERRRVPLKLIRAALLLGAARRAASPRAPLPPICSLYYFLPILEEVQNKPTRSWIRRTLTTPPTRRRQLQGISAMAENFHLHRIAAGLLSRQHLPWAATPDWRGRRRVHGDFHAWAPGDSGPYP